RLILKRIISTEIDIVFDIFHDKFDVTKAHIYGQDPSVIIISLRKGKRAKVFDANDQLERKVNFEIRHLFNCTGQGSRPPFEEDYRNGAV
ncbi:hypothetical protein CONLIGDRAFT_564130, partial [Coniochaeta ligniaria NRRL 30616]